MRKTTRIISFVAILLLISPLHLSAAETIESTTSAKLNLQDTMPYIQQDILDLQKQYQTGFAIQTARRRFQQTALATDPTTAQTAFDVETDMYRIQQAQIETFASVIQEYYNLHSQLQAKIRQASQDGKNISDAQTSLDQARSAIKDTHIHILTYTQTSYIPELDNETDHRTQLYNTYQTFKIDSVHIQELLITSRELLLQASRKTAILPVSRADYPMTTIPQTALIPVINN